MKKIILIIFCLCFCIPSNANALLIRSVAFGDSFNDNYSFLFEIEETADPFVFKGFFMNTSTGINPLIDSFAFNINADINVDFDIVNITPGWEFTDLSHIAFDILGNSDMPEDRLSKLEFMTFDFNFVNSFIFPDNPFKLWSLAPMSLGVGFGGGYVEGQVAASFQSLGDNDDYSELLCSTWDYPNPVPEPSTCILVLFGIVGLFIRRKNLS